MTILASNLVYIRGNTLESIRIMVLSLGKGCRTTYEVLIESGLCLLFECDHQSSGNISDIVVDKTI